MPFNARYSPFPPPPSSSSLQNNGTLKPDTHIPTWCSSFSELFATRKSVYSFVAPVFSRHTSMYTKSCSQNVLVINAFTYCIHMQPIDIDTQARRAANGCGSAYKTIQYTSTTHSAGKVFAVHRELGTFCFVDVVCLFVNLFASFPHIVCTLRTCFMQAVVVRVCCSHTAYYHFLSHLSSVALAGSHRISL